MPSKDTFTCKPIGQLVKQYLSQSGISIDPFARNNRWATYTNDINPNTKAEWHLDAYDFLVMLKQKGIVADLIIFDPPYSLEQCKRSYDNYGSNGFTFAHSQNVGHWSQEKNICYDLLGNGGYFLHFGWHSNGMGKKRHMQIVEILLVAHGRCHHDTICTVERKLVHQSNIF